MPDSLIRRVECARADCATVASQHRLPGRDSISLWLVVLVVVAVWAAGTARPYRGPVWRVRPLDTTEYAFAASLLVMLVAVALWAYDYRTVRMRAIATEALSLAIGPEICVQELWDMSGAFPAATSCENSGLSHGRPGHYVTAVSGRSERPAFDFEFGDPTTPSKGPRLSVTLAAGPGTPPATLAWRCGSAPIASRMTSSARDNSTLPWRERPSSCRGSNSDAAAR
jgi:hypothetical protein